MASPGKSSLLFTRVKRLHYGIPYWRFGKFSNNHIYKQSIFKSSSAHNYYAHTIKYTDLPPSTRKLKKKKKSKKFLHTMAYNNQEGLMSLVALSLPRHSLNAELSVEQFLVTFCLSNTTVILAGHIVCSFNSAQLYLTCQLPSPSSPYYSLLCTCSPDSLSPKPRHFIKLSTQTYISILYCILNLQKVETQFLLYKAHTYPYWDLVGILLWVWSIATAIRVG